MGIKQKISKKDLPKEFRKYSLIKTKDGVSDSVYLLGKTYVVKIYEKQSDEVYILSLLNTLCVPKVIKEFEVKGKYAVIFTQVEGKSLKKYPFEIVRFLKKMHNITIRKDTKNPQLFGRNRLESLIDKTKHKEFKKIFNTLELKLNDDGIIHGDLFPDNAKFIGKKLSGVYDFSEACVGDFYFDLAVVTFSFGIDHKKVLKVYQASISEEEFLEYIRYAKLYYAVYRYLDKREYKSILL